MFNHSILLGPHAVVYMLTRSASCSCNAKEKNTGNKVHGQMKAHQVFSPTACASSLQAHCDTSWFDWLAPVLPFWKVEFQTNDAGHSASRAKRRNHGVVRQLHDVRPHSQGMSAPLEYWSCSNKGETNLKYTQTANKLLAKTSVDWIHAASLWLSMFLQNSIPKKRAN